MFESLQSRLGDVLDSLTRRGALSEKDVQAALREVRVALLEADVALPVVRAFLEKVREKAVGEEVLRSVTPGQMVIKIVNDELVALLGGEEGFEVGLEGVKLALKGVDGVGHSESLPSIREGLLEDS